LSVKNTFKKDEKLCLKSEIDTLFREGKRIHAQSIVLVYKFHIATEDTLFKVLTVVPKRQVRKATKRNRLKRRMREMYRLNKHILYKHPNLQGKELHIALLYNTNALLSYNEIEKILLQLFEKLLLRVK
jgi:ribonuclease P protein component